MFRREQSDYDRYDKQDKEHQKKDVQNEVCSKNFKDFMK